MLHMQNKENILFTTDQFSYCECTKTMLNKDSFSFYVKLQQPFVVYKMYFWSFKKTIIRIYLTEETLTWNRNKAYKWRVITKHYQTCTL